MIGGNISGDLGYDIYTIASVIPIKNDDRIMIIIKTIQ
jgi:hypothetical protein